MIKLKVLFLYSLVSLCFLASCAQSENDKLGDAQFCLDELKDDNEAGVSGCLSKIEGLTSKESYLLRCSASFIQEGFANPKTLINIVQNMSKSNNSNPTAAVLSVLIFKSKSGTDTVDAAKNNETFAQTTQSYCISAQNKGMILISSFASMATSIASATASVTNGTTNLFDGTATPDQIKTAVANAAPAVIGSTAIVAYESNCTSGEIDSSKKDLCSTLSTAMQNGNNDPSTIGTALQNLIGKTQ